MERLRLGATGLHVPRLCLGMMSYYSSTPSRPWMLDEAAAEPIVRRAVEAGITFFDTSDMYSQGGSEVATGRLLGKLYREEERDMIPQCLDQGVGVLPWSPLARGLLAGNRTREGERRTTRAGTDAFADELYGRAISGH